MLGVSGGAMLLLSTPNGQVGHFYEAWRSEAWSKHRVTADEVPRISEDFLRSERYTLPDRVFRQEYYCSFETAEGAVFSASEVDRAFTDEITPLVIPSRVLPAEVTTGTLGYVGSGNASEEAV